jgi:hypothetical protein
VEEIMPYKDPKDPRQKEAWKRWYKKNKTKMYSYMDKYYERNKRFVTRYKLLCGCKLCGEKEPICLDFHHLRDKDRTIANTYRNGWSIKRIKNEIRKCILLCANCHRKVHAGLVSV